MISGPWSTSFKKYLEVSKSNWLNIKKKEHHNEYILASLISDKIPGMG